MNLRLDSASLYDALRQHVGSWRLEEHEFAPASDEVRISYDSAGSGRVALTVSFELSRDEMERVLGAARPAG